MDDISSQEQVVAVLKKTMESQNVKDLASRKYGTGIEATMEDIFSNDSTCDMSHQPNELFPT